MDCGWRNPEPEANNRSAFLKSVASNADCMERAVPPQTSGMRDVLSLFPMIALQPTSDAPPCHSFPQVGHPRTPVDFKLHHYRESIEPLTFNDSMSQ